MIVTLYERYEGIINTAFGALFSVMAGTGVWLIRRILTNQQQIAELKSANKALLDRMDHQNKAREDQRQLELQMFMDMRSDVKELRADVKTLFASRKG